MLIQTQRLANLSPLVPGKITSKKRGGLSVPLIILSLCTALLWAACGGDPAGDLTPTAADFTISGGTAYYEAGDTISVSIDAKPGKTEGEVTTWYTGIEGTSHAKSKTPPAAEGKYAVTFDVAASTGWKAAGGFNAGTLTISAAGRRINSIDGISGYLDGQAGGENAGNPIFLPLKLDLGIMPRAGSNWMALLAALDGAGKYVSLDLSACILTRTIFNTGADEHYKPDGMDYIVSVVLPDSVTSIGNDAFSICTNLTSVTIPNSVTSIGEGAFFYCTGLTSVTIPDSVTSIGVAAFDSCTGLTSVTIPDSVTSIGEDAFYYCTSLTSVTIPNSVTSIGDCAFGQCERLTSVTVDTDNPNFTSRENIVYSKDMKTLVFAAASLTSVTIPDSVTSIERNAFNRSGLTSVTIPDSVTSIGIYAFQVCSSLTSVTIGDSVESIGEEAFLSCSGLTSIDIPDSVTTIGRGAFSNCSSLTSVTIPDSVTTIGTGVFSGCSGLTSVTIPDSVTSIGGGAFSSCTSLTSVTSIDAYAFNSCTSLALVTCHAATPPALGSLSFFHTPAAMQIKVPAASVDAYKAAANWSTYASQISAIM